MADAVFGTSLGEPSEVIVLPAATEDGIDTYYIIQVSGREIRPLSTSAIDNAKQQVLSSWIDDQRLLDIVETFDRWRNNVPLRPVLDIRYLLPPPTAVPTATELALPIETPSESN